MIKILLCEDQINILNLLTLQLEKKGYIITKATNGKIALDLFENSKFDLVITDIMMPVLNGLDLLKYIREINQDIPVIILSALGEINDLQKGYDLLTDDYIVKPVNIDELTMKINAILRRSNIESNTSIVINNFKIDSKTRTVLIGNTEINLAKKEFDLLFLLLSYPNKIFTREDLLNNIWDNYDTTDRTVDVHIRWLREKIKTDFFEIKTIRGLGYKVVINENN